jgi:membrane protease YdiL (CAAX protease family)
VRSLLLVAGFGCALVLRLAVGGDRVATSLSAGLVFAAALVVLSVAARVRAPVTRRALLIGLGGLVLVVAPVLLEQAVTLRPLRGTQGFALWAGVVLVVASAEELFLRGALYDALTRVRGETAAIAVGAVLFALLHVPLYGWHVVPLDLAVGVVLGGLRQGAGTPVAPAVAHVGADWVGWFVS